MSFYDLPKTERDSLVATIHYTILQELSTGGVSKMVSYLDDEDTYIRKAAYLAIGKIYVSYSGLRVSIISALTCLLPHPSFKIRQTVINAAGEIGKQDFEAVQFIFDQGLFGLHHSPRNAVIGSVKKMGEVNPKPVPAWARKYLHHPDKEIRREICHGIELRGRKYPQDILPLLQELQHDKTARVRNTLVHVIGQIAYKAGCLAIVVAHLKTWENEQVVAEALAEIIDVHHRYRDFAALSQDEAKNYIAAHF